eukprot:4262278-Ditylum_brightwellii.AAC.1
MDLKNIYKLFIVWGYMNNLQIPMQIIPFGYPPTMKDDITIQTVAYTHVNKDISSTVSNVKDFDRNELITMITYELNNMNLQVDLNSMNNMQLFTECLKQEREKNI